MIDKNKAEELGIEILDSKKEQNPLYENLKVNFPQTIDSDGKPNLETIAMLLGMSNKGDTQGYELTFVGKGLANALYSTPATKELVYDAKQSISKHFHKDSKYEEDSKNLTQSANAIICGDNLDVLKILKSAYYEKIKMIYIDPPYNTKNENFIYPDDFRKDYKTILKEVGLLETDEEGNEIESKTLQTFRSITRSRNHSGWLSFMLPRLKLARDLLKEDGVIFISIDDNEQANLKILCDEIFGEENFVACLPRLTKKAGKTSVNIANNHDYLLCYQKSNINFLQISVNEEDYKEQDDFYHDRGGYKLNQTLDYNSLQYNPSLDYPISIDGKTFFAGQNEAIYRQRKLGKYSKTDWAWRWGKEKFEFGLKNGFIEIRGNRIYTKTYYKARISDKKPYKIEYIDRTKNISSIELVSNQYSNDIANKNLQEVFSRKNIFDYSKSVELLRFLISQTLFEEHSSDLILDFFAGSGTTAQAVMELNAEDGGNRKFILVQLPEPIDKDKNKTAYDFVKNELGRNEPTISDITIERVKRAGAKIAKTHKDFQGDLGFSVYSLCNKPNLVCNKEGHLKLSLGREGATSSDIARNLSLQCGKGLDKELKCIIESKLYKCDDMYCVVKCDDDVLEILGDTKNEYIFINGYADIKLEHFLNLKNSANINERLRIVY